MIYLSTLIFSIFITIALVPLFTKLAIRIHAMDIPDERKVHQHPIPRSGGIAMALGALVPVIFWVYGDEFIRAALIGTGIVVLFGFIDDFKNLGYKTKFAGQFCAALIVIFYGGVKINCLGMFLPDGFLLPDWFAVPLTLLAIVGVTNAVNLADGLDGLAGGMCILIFICMSYLAYRCGNIAIAVVSVAVIGAIFGFLRFNMYPASLFMGDSGSQFLGFLAITLSLKLTQGHTPLSPLVPLLLLGFPVLDTLCVMLERVAGGKSPFMADKNHFHHKLIRLGFFHTEAVFVIYVIQVFFVTSAFIFRFYPEWFLLTLYVIFSGIILSGFLVADRMGWQLRRREIMILKGRLQVLKDKNVLINISFRIVEFGFPTLLIFTCFLPANIHQYFSFLTLGFMGLIIVTWLIKKEWFGNALRLSLYLMIPVIVYIGEPDIAPWMNENLIRFYNLSFGVMAVFVILTLKFTRRKKGFKTTPMDFLILFVALVVPNLPDPYIQSYHLGLLAAKIIVLFFSFEVLMGELRGKFNRLGVFTLAALGIVVVRGLV